MTAYFGTRFRRANEIADLMATITALRARFDCPPAAEVESELRKPSPLGFASCVDWHEPEKPQKRHAVLPGWQVKMNIGDRPARFRVLCEPYMEDGELVVDLRGVISGVTLEGIPVSALDIRRWAAESQPCGQHLSQPHKAARR